MKIKIISICIIGIFLLSGFSLTALGMKANISTMKIKDISLSTSDDDIDLVYDTVEDANTGDSREGIMLVYDGGVIFVLYRYRELNYRATDEFNVSFYFEWDGNSQHLRTESCRFEEDQEVGSFLNLVNEDLPNKEEYPTLQIRMELDSDNDIDESNNAGNAEDNNIVYSNTLENPKAKSKAASPLVNILEKVMGGYSLKIPSIIRAFIFALIK